MLERAYSYDNDDRTEPRVERPQARGVIASEALFAIMVTDLEGFTPLVLRLGDIAAQRLIQAHNRVLRACLAEHQGDEVAHTGDGVIAAFRSVARALRCASSMQLELRRYNRKRKRAQLRVRIGLHAGEPLPEDGRLFGTCVNTAVRICAVTLAEQILVSDLVWQLAAGRPFLFQERGSFALKGLVRPVALHELQWRSRRPVARA